MGWRSAVLVMDAATGAADAAVIAILDHYRLELGLRADAAIELAAAERKAVDDAMRPYIATIAERLHEEGWDTEQHADAFERFSQEMLGMDDNAYEGWLRSHLADATHEASPERVLEIATRLKQHTDKTKGTN